MTILITLTTVGIDCSTFDIYSNVDGFLSAFETDVPKASLSAGFSSANVPDGTTIIRVKAKGLCSNYIDLQLINATTTTTSSSSSTTTSTTTSMCTLVITSTVTTKPTNVTGDNGTVTIDFSGGTGVVNYTLNTIPQGIATSPLVINGLVAENTYTVVLTDANNCSTSTEFTIGQSSFTFDADYIMLTYQFTDGIDLDIRTRIVSPDVGQNTQSSYIGWGRQSFWPLEGTPYLIWGGDNTGTGYESVLVNLNQFKTMFPSATEILMDARAFWFTIIGVNPVNIAATLWKGGAPVKDGCGNFCWTNPTAINTFYISSVNKVITNNGSPDKALTPGERLATLRYNLITGDGVFDNNDTTTPSV